MAARYWTPEQRAQQSAKIRQWQPWNKSTGARTAQGKAIVSRNAYKGAVRPKARKECKLLNIQIQRELFIAKQRLRNKV